MVTMEHCNSFRILSQVSSHPTADDKKSIERRSFVVLPFVASHIFKDCLIDASTAYVDCYVFVLVLYRQKLGYLVDGVAIELF